MEVVIIPTMVTEEMGAVQSAITLALHTAQLSEDPVVRRTRSIGTTPTMVTGETAVALSQVVETPTATLMEGLVVNSIRVTPAIQIMAMEEEVAIQHVRFRQRALPMEVQVVQVTAIIPEVITVMGETAASQVVKTPTAMHLPMEDLVVRVIATILTTPAMATGEREAASLSVMSFA
jgi:hypothetical protein